MWTPGPSSSSRPPGVQSGSVSGGPTGSLFGQNGVGPMQAAMISDSGVAESRRPRAEMVRSAVQLTETDFTFHEALPLCPSELSSLSTQAMHEALSAHLGDHIKRLVQQGMIAPNTQISEVRVSVINNSPFPLGCKVEMWRLDYDGASQSPLRLRNFIDGRHSTKDLSGLSAVIYPRKTVQFNPLPLRNCTDSYPSRAGVFSLRAVLRATRGEKGYIQVPLSSSVSRFITETGVAASMAALKKSELPPPSDTQFWEHFSGKYRAIATPINSGTAVQMAETSWRQFATQIIESRSEILMAADCYRQHPWEPKIQGAPAGKAGLSISFYPTDLVSDPPVAAQASAASNAFSKTNIYVIAASNGGSELAIEAVLRNTYMIEVAVTVIFALQPAEIIAQDNAELSLPTQ